MEEPNEPTQRTRISRKKEIRKYVEKKMIDKIKEGASKTKTNFYMENKKNLKIGARARYMDKCNRKTVNTSSKQGKGCSN